jgi:hypothetical protein
MTGPWLKSDIGSACKQSLQLSLQMLPSYSESNPKIRSVVECASQSSNSLQQTAAYLVSVVTVDCLARFSKAETKLSTVIVVSFLQGIHASNHLFSEENKISESQFALADILVGTLSCPFFITDEP